MSIQLITELNGAGALASDKQISSQIKESSQSNQYSFAEILSSLKENDKVEAPETEYADKASLNKSENFDEKTTEIETKSLAAESSNEKIEETVENNEKSQVVSSEKVAKNEKTENQKSVKNDSKEKVKKVDNKKTELKEKKSEENFNKYSRLEELIENAEKNLALNSETQLNKEVDTDIELSETLIPEAAVEKAAGPLSQIENNQVANNENTDDSKEFENLLNSKSEKSDKKITKLDKDGKITVEDQRTKPAAEEKDSKNEPKFKTEVKYSNDTATFTMELAQNADNDVLSLNNQTGSANGSTFQQMLNNQIQNNAADFVKAGNVILKDNNQGTINLVLHPDDLGNVKLHLSLDGDKITGHITVASKEAYEVFKNNSETLREAFIKNGFTEANFDVSYSGNNSFAQNSNDFAEQNDGRKFIGQRVYSDISSLDDSSFDSFFENGSDSDNYSINIVA